MTAAPIAARLTTPVLLLLSNVFMTYAWYGHLKDARNAPLWASLCLAAAAFFMFRGARVA